MHDPARPHPLAARVPAPLLRVCHVGLLAAAALLTPAAGAMPVDWSGSFLFAGAGFDNPLVRVAFNPQPEPPVVGVLSFGDPLEAGYPPDPIITHSGAGTGDVFRLLFGIARGGETLALPGDLLTSQPAGDTFEFDVLGEGVPGAGPPPTVAQVVLTLASASGGTPIDWVAFNPQPEPPDVGAGAASFGADFSFDSFSDVSLRVQVMDPAGTPIPLRLVPEPATSLLLVVGLGLLLLCAGTARPRSRSLLLVCLVGTPLAAGAGTITQADVTASGGFVGAYGGLNQGENPSPGQDLDIALRGAFNADERLFTGAGSASAATSFSSGPHANSASGSASLGVLSLGASSSSSFDTNSSVNSSHSVGFAHAGHVDHKVLAGSGLTPGDLAIMTFDILVDGTLSGGGFAASPGMEVAAFVDQAPLDIGIAGFDRGGSDPISPAFQQAEWFLTHGLNSTATRNVFDTVTFAAEVTVGTPFDLGVVALATGATRNSSGFPTIVSSGSSNFISTITWGGVREVLVGGTPVSDFSLRGTDTGIDWTIPFDARTPSTGVPAPGSLALLGLALAGLVLRGSRRRP